MSCSTRMGSWSIDARVRDGRDRRLSPRVFSFLGRGKQNVSVQMDADPEGNHLLQKIREIAGESSCRVSSALVSGQGRGVVSDGILLPGQDVCRVPMDCIVMTPARAVQMSDGLQALDEHIVAELPDWTILALYLVDVMQQRTNSSLYSAYSHVLPQETGCVLEWSDDDVELLRGSHLHTIASEIRHAAESTMADVEALPCPEVYKDRKMLVWALSILLTRVVRLGQDLQALCPGLDFFNHDCSSESFILLDENNRVYVKADRLYMPGDQVMISYGNQKTRGEFLLQYGFLPPASEKTYDACLFPIDIVLEDGDDVVSDGMGEKVFPLSLQGLPEGILKYAAVASIQEQQSGGYVIKQDNNILDGSDGDVSKETRKRALKWLMGRMKQRQHDMATSMEDAKRLVGKDGLDTRRQRIGAVLLHEHRVLSKAQFMAQQFYRQL
ncbi:[Fructose-bisphosphate aldolase]-lysine N-methyltransferase [Picochlorum sp. SENEW3]|nr:[Fructose-bisphosphate aldolase]-lysine N-methyltransferase [Picochlorum sp. SENEW3]